MMSSIQPQAVTRTLRILPARRHAPGAGLPRRQGGGQRGLTIIELMMGLVIVGVIAALGAPAMNSFVVQSRMTSQINDLLADVSFARNEAAVRGVRIGFCASTGVTSASASTTATCSSSNSDWTSGRIIFVDVNGDGQRNTAGGSTEILLKASPALTGSSTYAISLQSGTGTAPAAFQFRPYGGITTASTTGTSSVTGTTLITKVIFKLCPNSTGVQGRQLEIQMTGRPVISKVGC